MSGDRSGHGHQQAAGGGPRGPACRRELRLPRDRDSDHAAAETCMTRRLRIVVADDERNMIEFLTQAVTVLGHEVVASVRTGRELVERCQTLQPDLVITDIRMPELDGLEAAAEIYRQRPLPII